MVAAIRARRDELAHALTEDQGKPLVAEAYGEVDELIEYFRMAGEDAKRLEGSLPAFHLGGRQGARRSASRSASSGVVSPWNWPYTMGAEVFAPALAAGNTVVWVPAPTTAACSALLAEVIARGRAAAGRLQLPARTGSDRRRRRRRAPGRRRRRLRRLCGHG